VTPDTNGGCPRYAVVTMAPPRILTADRGDAGRRLDLVVRRHLTDVDAATRARVQAWIENGQVSVNGRAVRRVSARAALGDVVTVVLPDAPLRRTMAAEDVRLRILYEDEHMLALDKPAGVVVHPAYKNVKGTVMNALLWHARGWADEQRPSIVGRLDKLTSGVVVVAKTAAVHAALQRALNAGLSPSRSSRASRFGQLRRGSLDTNASGGASASEKDYLAVVYGRVHVAHGEIDLRIGHDRHDRRRMIASAHTGASSLTRFERLAHAAAPRSGLSLLRCRLVTGRRHQIRVHLAARGWPIVGDAVYGEPRWEQFADPLLAATLRNFPRQALHAWRVALTHPVTRERLQLEAPVPADFAELLTACGFP
jgi:23S rRNA pseudouridine1911/1915/1917 synthase